MTMDSFSCSNMCVNGSWRRNSLRYATAQRPPSSAALIQPIAHCGGPVSVSPAKHYVWPINQADHMSTQVYLCPNHVIRWFLLHLPGKTIPVADLTNKIPKTNFHTPFPPTPRTALGLLHRSRAPLHLTSQGDLKWGQHTGILPLIENTRQHIGAVNLPWMGNLRDAWESRLRAGEW